MAAGDDCISQEGPHQQRTVGAAQGPSPTWLLVVWFEALDPSGFKAPMGPL